MADDTPPVTASSGSGQTYGDARRPVYFYDLEMFTLRIENKLASLGKDLADSAARHAAYEEKVDKNASEVDKLRQHYHDMANDVTVLTAKTSALEPRLVVELIRLIPVMQHLERIAEKREMQDVLTGDELTWVRAEKTLHEERTRQNQQVTIGRRIQNYILPGLFALFILEQLVVALIHWHP